jgi:hypothetical protein
VSDTSYERLRQLAESDPAAFAALMKAVNSRTVTPHEGQKIVLESQARFRVMNCGRRWGKTVLAAKIFVSKARKQKQMLWWVAPTYRVVKRGYAEVLKQLPDGVLDHDPPPDTNFDAGRPVILRFKNGTRMEFYSAERPEGMLGAAVDFAVLDEAALMKSSIWNQIVSPTLIDHLGGALMISTPRGRNWFYEVWQKGQDVNQVDWDSWTFTTQDNPTLPEGEADRMAADMPRLEADQEIFAKWIAAGAQVFASALAENKVVESKRVLDNGLVEDVEVRGAVFLGVDLARTTDYTVFYGEMERNRRNCYFERMQAVSWSEQRRRIKQAVRRLMRSGAEHVTLMVDEGNAGSVIVEDLQEAGFDVVGVNFTTQKAPMVRLLANDLEEGKAFILDEGLSEFENYSITMTEKGRITYSAPEGQHDDIVSSKMLAHWGAVNEGFGQITMITADDPSVDNVESDPWDDEDDFSDLLDEDGEMTAAEVMEEIGLPDTSRRPTEQELLLRPDLWF